MKQFTASERVGPAKLPMSLDVGRLTARDAFGLFGLAIASLAVGAFGALIAWLAWPGSFGDISSFRMIFITLGLGIAALGIGLSALVAYLSERDWVAYQRRLDDYHTLFIDSYEQSGGVEVERTMTMWELTASHPVHVLAAALSVHEKASKGELAYSVRSLVGDRWIGGVRLGDVQPGQAEELSKRFAALGLVGGRRPGQAGDWVPQSADEVVQLVVKNWNKSR